jgi:hypothetical protein
MTLGLVVRILGDTKQLAGELEKGGGKVQAFGRSIDVGFVAKAVGAVAIGAVVVDTLRDLGTAAAEDQLEADQLAQAINAAGAATGDWATQVDNAIRAGQQLAFTDTQVRDALTPLVGVTGDMARAQELLSTAEDIARLKKIDLATAAAAVAKAEGGQATALAKLVGVNAKGLSSTEVLAEAQRRAAGQAKIYGDSTKGAGERASIAMDELGETIGSAVLPILDALLPAILPIIEALGELITAILPVVIPLFRTFASVLAGAARIVGTIARAIADFIGWVQQAVDVVVDFLSNLDPLKAIGDFIGGLTGPGLTGLAGPAGGVAGPVAGATFIVQANGADPEGVVRAIRRWAALNGGWTGFERAVTRG